MAQPPVPLKSQFWSNMVEWLGYVSAWYTANGTSGDVALNMAYYSGQRGAYYVKDYTGTTAQDAVVAQHYAPYVTNYELPNNGGVNGYTSFTDGQLEDVLRGTSRASGALASINRIFANAAFSASGTVSDDLLARECAYALINHVNAGRAGVTLTSSQLARRTQLLEWALGMGPQWTSGAADYVRPFMCALVTKALIDYFLYVTPDARVVPAVKAIADLIWNTCWRSSSGSWGAGQAFAYTDRVVVDAGETNTTPDLNLLIAPMYGFLWWQLGQQTYRDRGDLAWSGGVSVYSRAAYVSGAYLGTRSVAGPDGKHVNQQLFWGPRYIEWAEMDPVASPGGGVTPPTGSGGGAGGTFTSLRRSRRLVGF